MPTSVVEIGDALPPNQRGTADLLGRLYGVDLRFIQDYFTTGAGDLERTEGLDALKASLERALVTRPGEIFWRPTYGIGITDFLNLKPSAGTIYEIKNRIRSTLLSDPAVDELTRCDIYFTGDGLVEVFVDVKIAGQVEPVAVVLRRDE